MGRERASLFKHTTFVLLFIKVAILFFVDLCLLNCVIESIGLAGPNVGQRWPGQSDV